MHLVSRYVDVARIGAKLLRAVGAAQIRRGKAGPPRNGWLRRRGARRTPLATSTLATRARARRRPDWTASREGSDVSLPCARHPRFPPTAITETADQYDQLQRRSSCLQTGHWRRDHQPGGEGGPSRAALMARMRLMRGRIRWGGKRSRSTRWGTPEPVALRAAVGIAGAGLGLGRLRASRASTMMSACDGGQHCRRRTSPGAGRSRWHPG